MANVWTKDFFETVVSKDDVRNIEEKRRCYFEGVEKNRQDFFENEKKPSDN